MGSTLRSNNPGLRYLIDFWSKYAHLEDWHVEWARRHISCIVKPERFQPLYLDGEKQKNVYLVAQGILARSFIPEKSNKRQIYSVALPGMALMTTEHLFSSSPSRGDIYPIRANSLVIQIPYRPILEFKAEDPQLETLIDVLSNKKRKQLAKLRFVTYPAETAYDNYLRLVHELPEIHRTLTHEETADLLGISTSSAKRYHKKWLNS